MPIGRAEPIVDGDAFAAVIDAGRFETQIVDTRRSSGSNQEPVGWCCSTTVLNGEAGVLPSHLGHLGSEQDVDAVGTQAPLDDRRSITIVPGQYAGARLNQRDVCAQSRERLSELAAACAGADDNDRAGLRRKVEHGFVGEKRRAGQAWNVGNDRAATCCDDGLPESEVARALPAVDRHRSQS